MINDVADKKMVSLNLKIILQYIFSVFIGGFFVSVGMNHLTDPVWFEPIVPRILGKPRLWVYVSGVLEVLLGLAILIPRCRTWAGLSMAILLTILYWANLNMWINDIPLNGRTYANTWHILCGLAQIVLIGIVLWLGNWSISNFSNQKDGLEFA